MKTKIGGQIEQIGIKSQSVAVVVLPSLTMTVGSMWAFHPRIHGLYFQFRWLLWVVSWRIELFTNENYVPA